MRFLVQRQIWFFQLILRPIKKQKTLKSNFLVWIFDNTSQKIVFLIKINRIGTIKKGMKPESKKITISQFNYIPKVLHIIKITLKCYSTEVLHMIN